MNIQSVIYPELLLVLPSGRVQFVDGSAFVTDKALADEVREIVARAADLGIVVPDEAAPAEGGKPGKKPGKKSGKKADEELV